MLVIQKNGKTMVLTGWRAWLASTTIFIIVAGALSVIAFLILGIAVTMAAVLLIVLPAAIGIAILASMFRPRASR